MELSRLLTSQVMGAKHSCCAYSSPRIDGNKKDRSRRENSRENERYQPSQINNISHKVSESVGNLQHIRFVFRSLKDDAVNILFPARESLTTGRTTLVSIPPRPPCSWRSPSPPSRMASAGKSHRCIWQVHNQSVISQL